MRDTSKEELDNARKALSLPKYKAFDDVIGLGDAVSLFEDKFSSEAEMIDEIMPQIKPMIESVYQVEVKKVFREHWYRYRKHGYFDLRADIVVVTDECEIIIEAKNPTHTLRESLAGITQLMMYNVLFDNMEGKHKLIYLSSVIEPMVVDFIKKYDLDIDVFLWNGKQTAHWDSTLTN